MIDPRRARSRFGAVVAAALALGVLLALRLPTIQTPILNVDEADFAVEAGSLLDGGRPYVDFVEKKPPLIYAAYAGALSLVGRYNLPGVRLLLLGYVLATALVLGAITRRLFGPRAAWLVPPLYAAMVSAGPPMDVHAANPETFFLLPLLVGTRLALSARAGTPGPGLRRLLGAGAFLGVASLFKQQAAIQLPVLLLALLAGDAEDGVSAGGPATAPARSRWAFLRGLPSHARVRSAGALAAGFAAVWLVTLVVLAAIGSLGEFIYWTIDVNRYYIANGNNLPDSVNRFRRSVAMLVSFLPLVWIAGLGGLVWHLRRHRWRRPLLLLWLVGSLVPIVLGGRFFPHYFLQLFPPVVVLAAGFLAALWDRAVGAPSWRRKMVGIGAGIGAALVVVSAVRLESKMSFFRDPDVLSVPHATRRARAMAAYVREHTAPDARILVWGYGSALYHLAERRPATRFPYVTYLVGAVEGTPSWWSPFHPSRRLEIPRAWTLFFEDFDRHPPDLVIDTAPAGYIAFTKFPIEKYPALLGLLEQGYQRTQIEGFTVWRRVVVSSEGGASEGGATKVR